MENVSEKCLLCQSSKIITKEIIPFQELKEIWRYGGVAIEKYISLEKLLLKECSDCGLRFFEPSVGGNEEFYSLFQKKDYYQMRWDNRVISNLIRKYDLKSVLDYGCGQGEFLRLLPKNISKKGIDFNAENQQEENFELIKTNLSDFNSQEKFEGIICVQVLEHLANPKKHLEKMVSLLKERGYLFVCLPNKDGILGIMKNRTKPLDFPLHHLTRWGKRTLEKMAEIYNLKVVDIIEEPLSFKHFKWYKQSAVGIRYIGKSFKKRIIRKIIFLAQLLVLPFQYGKFRKKVLGHSILAVFQKNRFL